MEESAAGSPEPTAEQRSALLSALVTEQFVLQSIRGVETSEAASRSSLYLATLSAAMIALGFVSGGDRLGAFAGALIPMVFVLGLITFARLVALGVQDLVWLRGIERIRAHYRTLSPEAPAFFPPVDLDDPRALVRSLGLRPGPLALLSTSAALVAIVNAAVGGIGVAVLLRAAGIVSAVAVVVGVLAAVACAAGCLVWQWRRNVRGMTAHDLAGGGSPTR